MSENPDYDEELREVEALEAEVRRRKESRIPKERYEALMQLMSAELAAVESRETRWFESAIATAITAEECEAVTRQFHARVESALLRARAAMDEQMRAWTLAGLEDRAKEDDLPL
jgi:hypothetical protein